MISSYIERPASPLVLNKIFKFDDFGRNEHLKSYQEISELNSLNERELIFRIIKESNFNKNTDYASYYQMDNAYLVKNAKLELEYINKRREMKAHRSQIHERFTYYVTNSEENIKKIVNNGFNCSEDNFNMLGNGAYGIHLTKHLDIELEKQFNKKNSFYCILVKTLVGKTCLIEPSAKNISINPNFLTDCHLSKEIVTQSQDLDTRYANSLIYIYDYDKNERLNTTPRNALPFAVVEFKLKEPELYLHKSNSFYNLFELSNTALKPSMRKSLPLSKLSIDTNKNVFEKTPSWRESYERTGSLIDVLKSYLKDLKPENKFHKLIYYNRRNTHLKRSKTTSFSPCLNRMNLFTKSASCLADAYIIKEEASFQHASSSSSDLTHKSLHFKGTKMKRRRSYSASFCDELSSTSEDSAYYRPKRRLNKDDSLSDIDFSTDYSYYSSFSSVFESSKSDFFSHESSKNERDDTNQINENDLLTEEDVVYLNDCSGNLFSSQESDSISVKEPIKQEEPITTTSNTTGQFSLYYPFNPFNFSVPPPPLGYIYPKYLFDNSYYINSFAFNQYYLNMSHYNPNLKN